MKWLARQGDWETLGFAAMKIPAVLFLLVLLSFRSTLCAREYTLINQLLPRLAQAQVQGHKGWDTGITPEMKGAVYHYNETLLGMIKDLTKTYYRKNFISIKEIDEYLHALYIKHNFEQLAPNPSGEFQGSMAYLLVSGDVMADLENTIAEMVQAIVADDPKFNYKAWKRKWEQIRTH